MRFKNLSGEQSVEPSVLSPASAAAKKRNSKGKGDSGVEILPEWNLTDLYKSMDSRELKNDLARSAEDAKAFEKKYKDKCEKLLARKNGGDALAKAISDFENLGELMGRIGSYSGLMYTGDTTDPVRAKFAGDVQDKLTTASAHVLFFELELNRIVDADLDRAMKTSKKLSYYKPWLVDLRLDRPYQLEERVEQLFHEKSVTGRGAFNRLFDETMAGLKFKIGREEMPIEAVLNLLQDRSPKKRKQANDALSKVFAENLRLFTQITNTLAKDKEISDRWRGFTDVADSRHLDNRVEREVVDALVQSVEDAFPRLSHRYYKLKAKWLGMKQLNHWDRNAPLPEVPQANISWKDARQTVLTAYSGFSPDMAAIANDFFEKNWIDAPVRDGKSPGAFAHPTVPSVHPYVLLNYQGKPRDVMTLAHELGHGVHQVLAGGQGALMAQTPLTLAETASVFGEMLTFRSLLDQATTVKKRKAMLAGKVEDMINTVVRQIAFYIFERKVHIARREGELTSEQIGEFWMEVQRDSLGPAIKLGDGYENFWTYIPHFIHSPFYVYAYAFGDCLVNSLYAVYQNAEEGFQEKYFEMLKAGGSKHHSELLKPFGLDATDPAFWNQGLSVIEGLIDELEALDG